MGADWLVDWLVGQGCMGVASERKGREGGRETRTWFYREVDFDLIGVLEEWSGFFWAGSWLEKGGFGRV